MFDSIPTDYRQVCPAALGIVITLFGGLVSGATARAESDGSGAAGTRNASIQAARARIDAELNRAGDWQAWLDAIAPYQKSLQQNLSTAFSEQRLWIDHDSKAEMIEVKPDLFVILNIFRFAAGIDGYGTVEAIEDIETSDPFQTVVSLDRQLRDRGIDLLFVPVPAVFDIYPELLAEPPPGGLSVFPYRVAFMQRLLHAGVEVVDLRPALLDAKHDSTESLFLDNEWHWSGRGINVAAGEIGKRLRRYEFAGADTSAYRSEPADIPPSQTWILSPAHHDPQPDTWRSFRVVQGTNSPYSESPDAPVIVIGDSFVGHLKPQRADIAAHVTRTASVPTLSMWQSGGGPQAPRMLARKGPDFLGGRRVVVWVMNTFPITNPQRWRDVALPD